MGLDGGRIGHDLTGDICAFRATGGKRQTGGKPAAFGGLDFDFTF